VTDDWFDLLAALLDREVRFLVVGAHALAAHGIPRATQDLVVWIDPTRDNAGRVWQALADFGAPTHSLELTSEDLTRSDIVIQLGVPPLRIDLMTGLSGVPDFDQAWKGRLEHRVRDRLVPFLGRAELKATKRATGRPKDVADLHALGESADT
jgi:hypothetical protein